MRILEIEPPSRIEDPSAEAILASLPVAPLAILLALPVGPLAFLLALPVGPLAFLLTLHLVTVVFFFALPLVALCSFSISLHATLRCSNPCVSVAREGIALRPPLPRASVAISGAVEAASCSRLRTQQHIRRSRRPVFGLVDAPRANATAMACVARPASAGTSDGPSRRIGTGTLGVCHCPFAPRRTPEARIRSLAYFVPWVMAWTGVSSTTPMSRNPCRVRSSM